VKRVTPDEHVSLDDYAADAHHTAAVAGLRAEAAALAPALAGRTVWMISSTERGGGVAEMLPKDLSALRELGIATEWVVIESEHPEFFPLTKRIHNLMHGAGDPHLSARDREVYEAVSRSNADSLRPLLRPHDVLVVHDPQPLGVGAILKTELDITAIWRCHIGLDADVPQTHAAWSFLQPFAQSYDCAVFSAPEYIPGFLASRSEVIPPAIDPLSHKNRELHPHKLVGVLCNAALMSQHEPVLTPMFPELALRLHPDGTFRRADEPISIGLLFRPIVTQISRWDRLKGFRPLLEGFVHLKRKILRARDVGIDPRHAQRLRLVRLVLAGPDPASIADDPEAGDVLRDLVETYRNLDSEMHSEVAILALPMQSRKTNALMVNALQRCSTVVAQNSLREGFGLTVTEAMWKRIPVMGTRACGIRHQLRDGLDGRLVKDPTNRDEIAATLDEMLANDVGREVWGRNAQHRVSNEYLLFKQLSRWLHLLGEHAARPIA
jgi:trehalose synthase